ncbi:hypothetical protein KUCAC02_012445 [Chaenocephalus aceratus]|uniref:Uncharacterized protein n=1 Tax=Chaenocephalus aceratus TaxID=36190 RepID=A0ACB9XCR6_CHAAC|nr:hypothetical protein KUCAC02_012445 [Chaenocephalus aceratus]
MDKLTANDIMEPNLTYVYPHTRVQSLVSILRTTVYNAFPVVTENRYKRAGLHEGQHLGQQQHPLREKQGTLQLYCWQHDIH